MGSEMCIRDRLQTCLDSKLPNKGIPVDFPPVYGTLNKNQLLRAQQNQEGDTDIYRLLSRYTSFWQKYDALFQNCETKVYRWIFRQFTVHLNENQLLSAQQNPRGGCRYLPFTVTVYLFLAKVRLSYFKTAKQRYTGGFSASLRYIER